MRAASATHTLLPLAAVTAGLASGSTLAAEWTFSPSGDISAQSQRNPGLSTDKSRQDVMSNGLAGLVGLGVQRRTERTTLIVTPSVHAFRYADNNNFDRNEEYLGLSYNWVGEKITWDAGGSATRDTTLTSELGTTGLTQSNLRHEAYDVSLGPTWVLTERWQMHANLDLQDNRYPDSGQGLGLETNRYTTALLSTSYVVNEKLSLTAYGTASKLTDEAQGDPQGDDSTRNQSANIQAQYAWSQLSSINASIGQSWVKSGAGRNRGLLYSVAATHAFEQGTVSLSASRRQQPSGRALLTEADEMRIDASRQITERLSANASASYSKRRAVLRVFDLDLQRVRYSRADLGLSWRMASSWRLGLNIGAGRQQVGSAFNDDLTGRGYDARLGVSWNGDPYVR